MTAEVEVFNDDRVVDVSVVSIIGEREKPKVVTNLGITQVGSCIANSQLICSIISRVGAGPMMVSPKRSFCGRPRTDQRPLVEYVYRIRLFTPPCP
jgi:hypothetical protein